MGQQMIEAISLMVPAFDNLKSSNKKTAKKKKKKKALRLFSTNVNPVVTVGVRQNVPRSSREPEDTNNKTLKYLQKITKKSKLKGLTSQMTLLKKANQKLAE